MLEQVYADTLVGASGKLLHSMCDAVVHLDKELALTQKFDRLSMLLDTASVEFGTDDTKNFLGFLSNGDDRERFSACLKRKVVEDACSPGDACSLADAMHVGMQAHHGNTIQVQLYSACYLDMAGELCHLVAVRNDSSTWEGVRTSRGNDPGLASADIPGDWIEMANRQRRQGTGLANRALDRGSRQYTRQSSISSISETEVEDDLVMPFVARENVWARLIHKLRIWNAQGFEFSQTVSFNEIPGSLGNFPESYTQRFLVCGFLIRALAVIQGCSQQRLTGRQ